MKFKMFITVLILSLSAFSTVKAQTIDTAQYRERSFQTDTSASTAANSNNAADDLSPGMLFFALIGIALVFICIGVGVALAAVLLLALFWLISSGLLSASIIVGLSKRSLAQGLKTFLLLSGCIGGLALGIGALYLINKFFSLQLTPKSFFLIGGGSGLIGGLLLGLLVYMIFIKLISYFKQRIRIAT